MPEPWRGRSPSSADPSLGRGVGRLRELAPRQGSGDALGSGLHRLLMRRQSRVEPRCRADDREPGPRAAARTSNGGRHTGPPQEMAVPGVDLKGVVMGKKKTLLEALG